jgi:hypothetical protein
MAMQTPRHTRLISDCILGAVANLRDSTLTTDRADRQEIKRLWLSSQVLRAAARRLFLSFLLENPGQFDRG